jgi:hypothetical protein
MTSDNLQCVAKNPAVAVSSTITVTVFPDKAAAVAMLWIRFTSSCVGGVNPEAVGAKM